MTPTAKQLRETADVLDMRRNGLEAAMSEISDTLRALGELSASCRQRASAMDGKPLDTPAKRTDPKDKDFTL